MHFGIGFVWIFRSSCFFLNDDSCTYHVQRTVCLYTIWSFKCNMLERQSRRHWVGIICMVYTMYPQQWAVYVVFGCVVMLFANKWWNLFDLESPLIAPISKHFPWIQIICGDFRCLFFSHCCCYSPSLGYLLGRAIEEQFTRGIRIMYVYR